ncbi:hypothetical protein PN466_08740 [Roseofilum reptotaenium CS-1145]|uniref:hypothetical protein n=1 Tax=Roseofilum reptotaenium TaxID=1233427 RepID=UPI000A8F2974|nr:hypothetical protein [Roseofilum reptotaenium]MDB9517034.1 hypothetical protein [Roseofilum reptotaenium CS-1145]
MTIQAATLGYPHIGKNREVKKALGVFWNCREEVIPALKNKVAAAKMIREESYGTQE